MNDDAFRRDDYNALSDDDFRALARRFLVERHPPALRNPPNACTGTRRIPGI